jgi:glucose-1-phosphatase
LVIRTLIFDLGKVLVDFSYDEAYGRMCAASGLAHDEVRSRFLNGSLAADFESGRVDAPQFVAEVNARMGTALSLGDFQELWGSIFHPVPLVPADLLQSLRRRHRLLLLSNTNPLHFATIGERYPHLGHFDALIVSHEVGAMKPDASIYRAALDQAQCTPGECLFFDDLAENVEGALDAGLNARQFVGREKLLADLAEFGIKPE